MNPETDQTRLFLQRYSESPGDKLQFELLGDGVLIRLPGDRNPIRFKHSFIEPQFMRRARQSDQALVKACNNKQRNIGNILDMTGGWAMDSFILASQGHPVVCVEQNELVYRIDDYSLAQATKLGDKAAACLELVRGNSLDYLQGSENNGRFDCIFLDPMFPAHKSGAKSQKGLQILQQLTGNLDIQACFELALDRAAKRVVVKCPAKSAALFETQPDLVYREKTVRFDIYLTA